MVSRLATSLRQAPATVTALGALALFVVWATDDAGYPVTHWAPGGLVIAALLALCVGFIFAYPLAILLMACTYVALTGPASKGLGTMPRSDLEFLDFES